MLAESRLNAGLGIKDDMDIRGLKGNGDHGVYREWHPVFCEIKNKCLSKDALGIMCIGNFETWTQCETCLALHPKFNAKTGMMPNVKVRG